MEAIVTFIALTLAFGGGVYVGWSWHKDDYALRLAKCYLSSHIRILCLELNVQEKELVEVMKSAREAANLSALSSPIGDIHWGLNHLGLMKSAREKLFGAI